MATLPVDDLEITHAFGPHLSAGTRGGTEAYVDVGAAVELMGEPAELPADARDILLQVGTAAITIPSRDHQIEFHAVLTIDP